MPDAKKATDKPKKAAPLHTFDALPDTIDFRDSIYTPSLIRVPPASDIAGYRKAGVPVLDQGREGACTGFGLATVANYLLRVRGKDPKADEVSAWMLYAMAKRYDEWPGEDYSGSSARGAIKGWYKHGLCAWDFWKQEVPDAKSVDKRSADAIERPLGAYFRVNHRDLVAMHAAITEVGVLFATAQVHEGWQKLRKGAQTIPFNKDLIGGHAFAIVGYDRDGFWVQNSWGRSWGQDGIARLTYDDWLANGTDTWVASLGVPVEFGLPATGAAMRGGAPQRYASHLLADLKPHIITARNDGILDDKGDYGLTSQALEQLIQTTLPRQMSGWSRKRVLVYAHGGLVSQDSAVQTVANNREPLLGNQIYPLSIIWRSDAWTTLKDILQDVMRRRRDEGLLDRAKDFMLDRLDDMLEPMARVFAGKKLWDEMKENAEGTIRQPLGAARLAADQLIALHAKGGLDELHLVGHSAGSILHAQVAMHLAAANMPIDTVTLWAPACTVELFKASYQPLIANGRIKAFNLYTLDDSTERDDDCANIYHKSMLYLVSSAFENRPRIPGIRDGEPLLGMERFIKGSLKTFLTGGPCNWYLAPGEKSKAMHHGAFDDDRLTLETTLAGILGRGRIGAIRDAVRAPRFASAERHKRIRAALDASLTR